MARSVSPDISTPALRALATNKRMKWVWRELSKRQGAGYLHRVGAVSKRLARPATAAEWQAAGLASLFSHAIAIMQAESSTPSFETREEAEAACDAHATMARNLQILARTLGESAARYRPSDYPDGCYDVFRRLNEEETRKLEDAAEILEELAQVADEAAAEFPRRDRGNASVRRVTGELVKVCRIIFGKSLFGVVAIIGSVLFESKISESTIRAWHRIPANKTS